MSKANIGNAKVNNGLLVAGYALSAMGGLLGICIGAHIRNGMIKTPSGTKEFKYDTSSRNHGRTMILTGLLATVVWLGIRFSLGQ
jgi:hypothetical protein